MLLGDTGAHLRPSVTLAIRCGNVLAESVAESNARALRESVGRRAAGGLVFALEGLDTAFFFPRGKQPLG
jgi:hypothetical protein